MHARHVHQIGDHGAGRGLAAGTLAVVQRGADGIGMHHHGVHGAFHIGDQAPRRDERGVHAQLHALGRVPADAQQLDAVAHLLGVADVGGGQMGDALDVGFIELHVHPEGNCTHERDLVCRIDPFDVEGRIGLCIAELLGIAQSHVEIEPLVAHLAQDEVGGAVDDSREPLDAVGRQSFTQGLDDGNATGHCRLEGHHHALLLRRRENLAAMHGQQCLVGSHHVLALGNGLQHHLTRHGVAPDELHHDIDVGTLHQGGGVVRHLHFGTDIGTRPGHVTHGNGGHLDAATGTPAYFFLIAAQNGVDALAHVAKTEKADSNGMHAVHRAESEGRRERLPVGRSQDAAPWRLR